MADTLEQRVFVDRFSRPEAQTQQRNNKPETQGQEDQEQHSGPSALALMITTAGLADVVYLLVKASH